MMRSEEKRSGNENTGKSAAEQIRGQLEQFPEEEFILQIPLNAAEESGVKNRE
jgi:hypothetical protein